MHRPLISVVLATHERCRLLPRAIDSVLGGTYDNFEIIIIDDASRDETPEVIRRLHDPRIRHLRLPENIGALGARNRGLEMARGDYISFLDDDDALRPDALRTIADEIGRSARDGIDVLWFDCVDVEASQKSGSMHIAGGTIRFDDYLCGRIQGDFFLVFSRAALRGTRFDERLLAHESLLWLRIHRTHQARYVPTVILEKYRNHGGPRLCDLSVRLRQLKETTLALSLYIEEFGDDLKRACPPSYGHRLAYLGLHQMAVNQFSAGRASVLRSLKYRPSVKYLALYLSSFLLSARQVVALMARAHS